MIADAAKTTTADPMTIPLAAREPSSSFGARLHFFLASIMRWSERLIERVVSGYERTFNLDERDAAEIYMAIGADLVRNGKNNDAAEALGRTLAIQPENGDAWFQLGLVQLRQRACAQAIASFAKARQLGADNFDLHYYLAEAHAELEQHELATQELRIALEQQPTAAEAAYRLGVALDKLQRYEEAVAAFRLAIAHDPRVVSYYQSLGFALESLGQRDEAIEYFKRAVNLERRIGA